MNNSKFKEGDKALHVFYGEEGVKLEPCKITGVFWSSSSGFSYGIQRGPISQRAEKENLFASLEDFQNYWTDDKIASYVNNTINAFNKQEIDLRKQLDYYTSAIQRLEKRKNDFLTNKIKIKAS
jgi:hypothetical protein